ncbi:tRNA glutamyl-Q(34) synthetase GluQRS [Niveibacterium terrae]|uniref:tRNA glutamyl-Q(34) synthetase GluQRS n=1 Tax=Niveibacterium terrae TaxID=3373598 RepID=UPI003A957590
MTDRKTNSFNASHPTTGRFAPSPSGALHFGSLIAALASWLDARAQGGRWLLRIEDIDTPRNVAGADERIIATLANLGLEWDGEIVWQSHRLDRYREALARLSDAGRLYGCACTRREIADSRLARDGAHRYPGTCRAGLPEGRSARAWRVRTDPETLCFEDLLQGRHCENIEEEVGDFVLKRADGLFAYQLAVVVDDAEQGVTEIVRGADLLASTPRQIFLQRLLGYPEPRYLHLPVACNADGEKLSKQTRAPAITGNAPAAALAAALTFLGQQPPADAPRWAPRQVLDWALANWDRAKLPRRLSAPAAMDCPESESTLAAS